MVGLCSQKYLGSFSKDAVVDGVDGGGSSLEKRRRALFTPPRKRPSNEGAIALSSSKPLTRNSTCSTSSDFELEDSRGEGVTGERQPAFGAVRGEHGEAGDDEGRGQDDDDDGSREYDEDEEFILGRGKGKKRGGGGVWERMTAGATRSGSNFVPVAQLSAW